MTRPTCDGIEVPSPREPRLGVGHHGEPRWVVADINCGEVAHAVFICSCDYFLPAALTLTCHLAFNADRTGRTIRKYPTLFVVRS
jgi:hypothetical protein